MLVTPPPLAGVERLANASVARTQCNPCCGAGTTQRIHLLAVAPANPSLCRQPRVTFMWTSCLRTYGPFSAILWNCSFMLIKFALALWLFAKPGWMLLSPLLFCAGTKLLSDATEATVVWEAGC